MTAATRPKHRDSHKAAAERKATRMASSWRNAVIFEPSLCGRGGYGNARERSPAENPLG